MDRIVEPRLSPFAADPVESRGRLHYEPESAHRSPYQRDRDRIIHSSAFRRLKHKTQVFVEHEGDYYRTRLTHSIEVAQIARTIARHLRLDEDLAEALALAHDLGHTPFGHSGAEALAACMAPYGGFEHNAQTLRIVTKLEAHYADFDGLNLTWETLEGIAKHNGPLLASREASRAGLAAGIAEADAAYDLALHTQASAEAQVAALADDIAYVNHDILDGLRAELFATEEAETLPLISASFAEVDARYPGLAPRRRRHEALRRVFGLMVEDLLSETERRLEAARPGSLDVLQHLGHPVAAFSATMQADIATIKAFLFERMYRHWRVNRMRVKAVRVVEALFAMFMAEHGVLPPHWRAACGRAEDEAARARVIADYIAGMTDRYALEEHRQLTEPGARP
ncbi:MAG: deoxyguanosinetriphosphate triphosphohydrolase [Pseudomonadota bacterium]